MSSFETKQKISPQSTQGAEKKSKAQEEKKTFLGLLRAPLWQNFIQWNAPIPV